MGGLADLGQRLIGADSLSVADQIKELSAVRDQLDAAVGILVDHLRETGGLGTVYTNPSSWLAATANTGRASSARTVSTGRLARHFTVIREGIEEGTLGRDHLVWLKKCLPANRTTTRAELFARDHKMLVDFARDYTYNEFVTICRNWIESCNAVDPDLKAPEDQDLGIDFTDNRDGTTTIKGLMLTSDANALKEALTRLIESTKAHVMDAACAKEYSNDRADHPSAEAADGDALAVRDPIALDFSVSEYTGRPVVRKGRRYWMARAVTVLCSKALTAPADGKSPEPLVVVHIDHDTFVEERDRYVANGPPPDPGTVFREGYLSCDSQNNPYRPGQIFDLGLKHAIARCMYRAESRKVDLGRKSRVFTGAAREAVIWRDRLCRVAGCDQPGQEVDHIVEWDQGGETNPENGQYLCRAHHAEKTMQYNRTQRAANPSRVPSPHRPR